MYRVLYNDTEHGLQIITEECVEEVALGYNNTLSEERDTSVSASDFDLGLHVD